MEFVEVILGLICLSLGEILLFTKAVSLLHKKVSKNELVLFRWIGIGLMCGGVPFLHYFVKIESALVLFFALGFSILIGGGKILFTHDGLEWMYQQGIWKAAWPFNEKSDRTYRRLISGGGFFVLGLIWTTGSLVAIFYDLLNK
jgi:hypothetical protein